MLVRPMLPECEQHCVVFLLRQKHVPWCRNSSYGRLAVRHGQALRTRRGPLDQALPPLVGVEDRLAKQRGDRGVRGVGPRELALQQTFQTRKGQVPATSCPHEAPHAGSHRLSGHRCSNSTLSEQPVDVLALGAVDGVEGELCEWRREDLDRDRWLVVTLVHQAMQPHSALLHRARRAFCKDLLRLDTILPRKQSSRKLLVAKVPVNYLQPHGSASSDGVSRDELAWTPAGHNHGELIITVDDMLHRVKLAKVCRTGKRCPLHG
mmetsp:Transcript_38991/g.62992  ORF Transcript_38991/g.62992 Transcript_38991/m.62992 type:complete len:264 (+) Transcript_38991:389-1180(+)